MDHRKNMTMNGINVEVNSALVEPGYRKGHRQTLADFHSCSSQQILYEWKYKSAKPEDGFSCYINAEVGNCRTTFNMRIEAERDTTRESTGPITEIKKALNRYSTLIQMKDIARDLKVDDIKMKDLHMDNKGDAAGEKHGIIELCVNTHGNSFPEKLKATLKALNEICLLEKMFPIVLKIETQV